MGAVCALMSVLKAALKWFQDNGQQLDFPAEDVIRLCAVYLNKCQRRV